MATASFTLEDGEIKNVPFAILTAAAAPYDLTGKRVTWSCATSAGGARILRKTSDVGSELSIDAPLTLGTGLVKFVVADFAILRPGRYAWTLWVDSAGVEEATVTGILIVTGTVPRAA